MDRPQAPAAGRAWYVVALLVLLYAFSNVDRYVIALLVQPLSRDLGISDTQLGLLLGLGFALFYCLASLPFATLVDRGHRRGVVAGGAVVWSLMTILSAFAPDAPTFVLCRIGLAIGEAALTPAAISLIADLFPKDRRALPTSLYVSVASVMVTGALAVGAAALDIAKLLSPLLDLAPWRIALILCGLPGVALGLLFFLTVKDPPQGEDSGRSAVSAPPPLPADARMLAGYLHRNRAFYIPFYLGAAVVLTFVTAIAAWTPTLLVRSYGLTPSHAGYLLGAIGVPASLAGAFLWPAAVGALERRGRTDGAFICLIGALLLAGPLLGLLPWASSILVLGALFAAAKVLLANSTIMPPLILQTWAPPGLRGRLVAVNLLAMNVGFAVGPVLTPQLAKAWPADPDAIGHALAFLCAGAAPLGALHFYLSRRALRPDRLIQTRTTSLRPEPSVQPQWER